jgi:hypothetical protein
VCKPRQEMSMKWMREEEVVLVSAIVEVGVVDVSGE